MYKLYYLQTVFDLHDHGFAHSVEVKKETLVGGLYGLSLEVFFAESMFSQC